MSSAARRPRGPLRVAVLGEPGGWHMGRLLAAVAARGHRATAVRWPELAAAVGAAASAAAPAEDAGKRERFLPETIDSADLVVVRGMPFGSLEEIVFRMDLLGRLAARGTPVVNSPRCLEVSIDKYLCLARLAAAGLPVPATVVAQDPGSLESAWRSLGRDCDAKPLFGSCGRGLVRITDEAKLDEVLAAAAPAPGGTGVVYLQEFVPNDGWDARILVVGEETVAIRRVAPPGDWRTNLSLGGRPEAFDAPREWLELAREAARVVDAGVAGVDLLQGRDGRVVVLEVNAVPGWRGLETAASVDVADRVVRYLERLTPA